MSNDIGGIIGKVSKALKSIECYSSNFKIFGFSGLVHLCEDFPYLIFTTPLFSIKIWEINKNQEKFEYFHTSKVSSITYSNKTLVSMDVYENFIFCDLNNFNTITKLHQKMNIKKNIFLSSNKKYLICHNNKILRILFNDEQNLSISYENYYEIANVWVIQDFVIILNSTCKALKIIHINNKFKETCFKFEGNFENLIFHTKMMGFNTSTNMYLIKWFNNAFKISYDKKDCKILAFNSLCHVVFNKNEFILYHNKNRQIIKKILIGKNEKIECILTENVFIYCKNKLVFINDLSHNNQSYPLKNIECENRIFISKDSNFLLVIDKNTVYVWNIVKKCLKISFEIQNFELIVPDFTNCLIYSDSASPLNVLILDPLSTYKIIENYLVKIIFQDFSNNMNAPLLLDLSHKLSESQKNIDQIQITNEVNQIVISPDGLYAFYQSMKFLYIINLQTWKLELELTPFQGHIKSISILQTKYILKSELQDMIFHPSSYWELCSVYFQSDFFFITDQIWLAKINHFDFYNVFYAKEKESVMDRETEIQSIYYDYNQLLLVTVERNFIARVWDLSKGILSCVIDSDKIIVDLRILNNKILYFVHPKDFKICNLSYPLAIKYEFTKKSLIVLEIDYENNYIWCLLVVNHKHVFQILNATSHEIMYEFELRPIVRHFTKHYIYLSEKSIVFLENSLVIKYSLENDTYQEYSFPSREMGACIKEKNLLVCFDNNLSQNKKIHFHRLDNLEKISEAEFKVSKFCPSSHIMTKSQKYLIFLTADTHFYDILDVDQQKFVIKLNPPCYSENICFNADESLMMCFKFVGQLLIYNVPEFTLVFQHFQSIKIESFLNFNFRTIYENQRNFCFFLNDYNQQYITPVFYCTGIDFKNKTLIGKAKTFNLIKNFLFTRKFKILLIFQKKIKSKAFS